MKHLITNENAQKIEDMFSNDNVNSNSPLRVYVGSISFELKEDTIRQAFLPFGPIKSINMSWDPITQKHKGFAFVEYDIPEAAQLSLEQMNGVMLGGRNIKVVGRPSNMPQAQSVIDEITEEAKLYNRIYVASIHPDLTEEDIKRVPVTNDLLVSYTVTLSLSLRKSRARVYLMPGSGTYLGGVQRVGRSDGPAYTQILTSQVKQVHRRNGLIRSLFGFVLDKSIAFVPVRGAALLEFAVLDRTKRFEYTVRMYGGDIDSVVQLGLLRDLIDDRLCLGHIAGSSDLDMGKVLHYNSIQEVKTSRVVILRNMVGPEDVDESLQEEIQDECGKYGQVEKVVIYNEKQSDDEASEVIVKIFVSFSKMQEAEYARDALNGRFFAGRMVRAELYDQSLFDHNDFSG
ncbi:poly(U)-binding-splicing factor half pint [Diaphorina citri]|uniref:Poly(U)-binding-splicing factor half pint n=1 Tax=Diaphorina citri TaxID=121845 RepID=A0A3Q0IW54_DIACI|nr:poly(U)-binding-splicing factor half pint [Diaphorina citri]